jgi:hypothetical protein
MAMSPQDLHNWSDAAAKFIIPILLGVTTAFTGCSITQVEAMRKDISELKVKVAELSMEFKIHSTERNRGEE